MDTNELPRLSVLATQPLKSNPLSCLLPPVQRESFDVIGKVGFGRDFQASKDIDNPVNTFQQLTDDLEESVHRLIHPWRKYSLSKVPWHPHFLHLYGMPLLGRPVNIAYAEYE